MTPMTDGSVIHQQPETTGSNSQPADPLDDQRSGPHLAAARPSARPHAQLSRSQILDATEQCLVARGYDGTTIRHIAAILSCAVGSIYRYFTDKRQLLQVVTQRRFRPVLEQVRARQRVAQTARLYAQVATDQPELYRLMFWLAGTSPATPDIIRQIIDGWAPALGGTEAAELFWSRLHGRLMLGGAVDSVLTTVADTTALPADPIVEIKPDIPTTSPRHLADIDDVTLL